MTRRLTGWVALGCLAVCGAPSYAGKREVLMCLAANDIPCADAAVSAMGRPGSTDPEYLSSGAETDFWAGRYPQALEKLELAEKGGFEINPERMGLVRRTTYVTAGWVEVERGRFIVRYKPGLDAVLVEEAFSTLEQANRGLQPYLGDPPPGKTILELYPDKRSFIAASSLTEQDVLTTGVVAISKWSRLLVLSPRVKAEGYDWRDTVAHEYAHLVVGYHSMSNTPVWLQESIAKYLDGRWRDGTDNFELSVMQRGLLRQALADDDLVTFAEMHPSFAKLPTAERAALAYGQVALLMRFCFAHGGEDLLKRVLPRLARGEDPAQALAVEAGYADFPTLEAAWKDWLHTLPLGGPAVKPLPTVLAEGQVDDASVDPVLSERADLMLYVQLGNRLRDRVNRPRAALVEYQKAIDPEEPVSPVLFNHMAKAHQMLGELDEARSLLKQATTEYPDFGRSWLAMAKLSEEQGQVVQAKGELDHVLALRPASLELRRMALSLCKQTGDSANAARHERAVRILERGGEDVVRAPIHQVTGEFALPQKEGDGLNGAAAPGFDAIDFDGQRVRLEEYAGKVVVVDFWATWCGPCRAAMPELEKLNASSPDVVVVGLSDEDETTIKRFLQRTPLSYRIARDQGGTKDRYGVRSLPTVVVIGRDGVVVETVVGAGPSAYAALHQAVERALAAPAP